MIEKSLKTEIPAKQRSQQKSPTAGDKVPQKANASAEVKAKATPITGDAQAQSQLGSGTLFEAVIAGVPLRLKSSHDEQTVNELVQLVDSKVREALPLTKTGSIQNAAILAALHLAEEYLLLKRKAKGELDSLEAKTLKVISELESSRVTTGLPNN